MGTFEGVWNGIDLDNLEIGRGNASERVQVVIAPAIVRRAADIHGRAVSAMIIPYFFMGIEGHLIGGREFGHVETRLEPQPHPDRCGHGLVEFAAQCDAGGTNAARLNCNVKRIAGLICPAATSS